MKIVVWNTLFVTFWPKLKCNHRQVLHKCASFTHSLRKIGNLNVCWGEADSSVLVTELRVFIWAKVRCWNRATWVMFGGGGGGGCAGEERSALYLTVVIRGRGGLHVNLEVWCKSVREGVWVIKLTLYLWDTVDVMLHLTCNTLGREEREYKCLSDQWNNNHGKVCNVLQAMLHYTSLKNS